VTDVSDRSRIVVHLVGSPVDEFHAELSRLYAGGCLQALDGRYDARVVYVSPGGAWRFPKDLSAGALASAAPMSTADGLDRLASLGADVVIPQMFCAPGMTAYRTMLDALEIPYVGNRGSVMATAVDKARTREIVSAAGVSVPYGRVVHDEEPPTIPLPVVVKPVTSDNSVGVSLVRTTAEYPAAVRAALLHDGAALVESYVEAGREVRCGTIVRDGELVCLPLEEYEVDSATKPIRGRDDKLARSGDGDLYLVAKDAAHAWIVPEDDPVTAAVWEAARRCHVALDCRHYGLFDFRIDPDGHLWFLEAGLYCSFSPSSVIAVMAASAGITVDRLFADVLAELDREEGHRCTSRN
jgi:D-alanine-D-alanine ligase